MKLRDFFNSSYLDKVFIIEKQEHDEKEYYEIRQNDSSLNILFYSLLFPNVQSFFFLELFNLFQNLYCNDENSKFLYQSYSQAFTTYGLKKLAKYGFIELILCKKEKKVDLSFFKSTMDPNFRNYENYYVDMFKIYFYKEKSFTIKNLELVYEMANFMGADTSIYCPYIKNNCLYLKLDKKFILSHIKSGKFKKNLKLKSKIINLFLENLKEEFLSEEDMIRTRKKD